MEAISKLVTTQVAGHILNGCRLKSQKIVFTNGCFDLLHPGHVTYLQQAKALGDFLVVAVNSDASVKRLKGNKRPVLSLEARLTMLNALSSVDMLLSFEEDTPQSLIEILKPDVLVKGGDYKLEDIVGADFVQSNGGVVQIIPFLEGYSATGIIRKIIELEK